MFFSSFYFFDAAVDSSSISHQLPDRDGDLAALPRHQPRLADPLFLVSRVALGVSGEDHASQVVALAGPERSDPSR